MSALAAESWTWYGLTWMVVIVRMFSRRIVVGSIKKLQVDDYLMIFAMLTDTVLIASMNIISHTSSNLLDPNEDIDLTPDEISEREFGSKMVLVVEQMQILTIWAVKGCLLLMYNRLTMSLSQNRAVKIVAAYVIVGFIVMEILYLGVWCRPFTEYWAVPPDNVQCSAATNHLITNAVLNISSDIMIILIPMPIFLQSQIPTKKKIILCGIFAVGSFTILSAVLNKYYSFTDPFGADWTFWYIRESSTALIAANLPMTWTLLRRFFHLKSWHEKSSGPRSTATRNRFRSEYARQQSQLGTRSGRRGGDEEEGDTDMMSRAGSQEQINAEFGIPLKIYQHHEVQISTEPVKPGEDSRKSSQDSVPDGRDGVRMTTKVSGGVRNLGGGGHGRNNDETRSDGGSAGGGSPSVKPAQAL